MNDPTVMRDTLAALGDTGIEVFDVEIIRIGPDFAAAHEHLSEAASRLQAGSVANRGRE